MQIVKFFFSITHTATWKKLELREAFTPSSAALVEQTSAVVSWMDRCFSTPVVLPTLYFYDSCAHSNTRDTHESPHFDIAGLCCFQVQSFFSLNSLCLHGLMPLARTSLWHSEMTNSLLEHEHVPNFLPCWVPRSREPGTAVGTCSSFKFTEIRHNNRPTKVT